MSGKLPETWVILTVVGIVVGYTKDDSYKSSLVILSSKLNVET